MALTKVGTDGIKDDAVTIAKQAAGTDGQIITYDASGNPKAIGPGTDGQVLTSAGAGAEPAFEDAVSEGTQVKSTGESGGTKFLREDGDGTCSWQTLPSSGAALTGSTNNTVVTVTGANAMAGEANLVFDGSKLGVNASNNDDYDTNAKTALIASSGNTGVTIRSTDVNAYGAIAFAHGTSSNAEKRTGRILYSHPDKEMVFYNNESEVMRFKDSDDVEVANGNVVIKTSGKGIDFSAQTATSVTGASTDAELLDHYEEGQWTPTITVGTMSTAEGNFTRIGRMVFCVGKIVCNSDVTGGSSYPGIGGLPFTTRGNPGTATTGVGAFGYNNIDTASNGPWTISMGKWNTSFSTYRSSGSFNNADQYTSKTITFAVTYEC